jgi:hypothetical protein
VKRGKIEGEGNRERRGSERREGKEAREEGVEERRIMREGERERLKIISKIFQPFRKSLARPFKHEQFRKAKA